MPEDFCGELKVRNPTGGYGDVQFGVKQFPA
jgi:hypothetical protein